MSEKFVEFGKSVVLTSIMLGYFIVCFAILYFLGWITVFYGINCIWTTLGILFVGFILSVIPFIQPFKSIWYKWTL